jgi:hypothetical protein
LIKDRRINEKEYDHSTGKFLKTKALASNDIIVICGLHAIYSAALREMIGLKIFLSMDEDLRRALKIKRDVEHRGHSREKVLASIERRLKDYQQYIEPQRMHADLAISLYSTTSVSNERINENALCLAVEFSTKLPMDEFELRRVLVGALGLNLEVMQGEDPDTVNFAVHGEISAQDVAFAAEILVSSEVRELLPYKPFWKEGVSGIIQLIVLMALDQKHGRLEYV